MVYKLHYVLLCKVVSFNVAANDYVQCNIVREKGKRYL